MQLISYSIKGHTLAKSYVNLEYFAMMLAQNYENKRYTENKCHTEWRSHH